MKTIKPVVVPSDDELAKEGHYTKIDVGGITSFREQVGNQFPAMQDLDKEKMERDADLLAPKQFRHMASTAGLQVEATVLAKNTFRNHVEAYLGRVGHEKLQSAEFEQKLLINSITKAALNAMDKRERLQMLNECKFGSLFSSLIFIHYRSSFGY